MFLVILIITSVFEWCVKAYHALCFPLKVGRSAMACFCLLHVGYDTEVICIHITEPVFYCSLLIIVLCDLYFDSHILLCLCITLILILYVISIKCVYVREYYEYSLTTIKSLL